MTERRRVKSASLLSSGMIKAMRAIQRDIVGAFIFSNDGHVLFGKNAEGGVYKGLWIIPAGGVKSGETILQTCIREVSEEVGIDIAKHKVTQIDGAMTGESEKTLSKTGETVMVQMTFYNFKVEIDQPAHQIETRLEDDLSEIVWAPFSELPAMKFSPSVEEMLKRLGCL